MLKILRSDQLREADAISIQTEPISSIALMERAAGKCFDWIKEKFSRHHSFLVFCGKGNNGGDGLAIARMLLKHSFAVKVIVVGDRAGLTEDNKQNLEALLALDASSVSYAVHLAELAPIDKQTIIIDALFGTGLSSELQAPYAEIVERINQSTARVISIDIPSGMFADKSPTKNKIIHADFTLTFQTPKLAFLLPETGSSIGELVILDIGLNEKFIQEAESPYFLVEESDVMKLLKKRNAFAHKGNFGHALLVAGSDGKMGAALLCVHSCLRSGAGLVSAVVPSDGRAIMQSNLPEAMLFGQLDAITETTDLSIFSAIGIGPGIGTSEKAKQSIKALIQNFQGPVVFDADAINCLAENKTWLGFLSPNVVFTPHLKEFERLVGKAENDFHRLELAKNFAIKYQIHLIIKGKYTCIVCPDGKFYFNSTGNPGMAKGGSGDVLTGIITGLLAQGYASQDACVLGVYIHGKAGDIAAGLFSETAMLARDIINAIPETYKILSRKNS